MAFDDEDGVIAVDVIVEEVIVGTFDAEGAPGARGPDGDDGWSPVFATVSDGARRVQQLVNWIDGTGTQPGDIGKYVGLTGFVTDIADAIDIRGPQGNTGAQGPQGQPGAVLIGEGANIFTEDRDPVQSDGGVGDLWINNITGDVFSKKAGPMTPSDDFWDLQSNITGPVGPQGADGADGVQGAPGVAGAQGLNGWSPLYTTVVDGQRIVLQNIDWVGGSGSKPSTGLYMGVGALVSDIALAVNIRGAAGAGTPGVDGANGLNFYRGIGVPSNSFGRDNETYLDLTPYNIYSKAAGVWTLVGSIKGAPGADGAPGTAGAQGLSFRWSTVDPVAGDGNNGDTWLNTTTYHIWTKAAGAWTDRGSIKGAQGDQGPQGNPGTPGAPGADSTVPGPPGNTGPAGAAFLTGAGTPSVGLGVNGDSYTDVVNGNVYKKAAGAWGSSIGSLRGPQGTAGTAGSTGATGARGTLWYFGSGAPGTIPGALALDKYVNTDDGDVYEYSGSAWVDASFNIKGVQGDQGPQGNPGTAGGTGPAGFSFRSGAGVPSNALGNQGDNYLNTTNGDVYGPKGASTWGAATGNIRGPQGTAGADGAAGAAGSVIYSGVGAPSTGLGVINDFYLNSTNGDYYKKTGTTVWTLQLNLVGPAGTPGTSGTNGTNGTQLTTGTVVPTGGANGDLYIRTTNYDLYKNTAGTWAVIGNIKGADGINAADLMYFFPGKPTASQEMVRSVIKRAFNMTLTSSSVTAAAAATATSAWTLKKNGTTVATATWSAAGTVAAITGTSPVAWAVDDVLTVVAAASVDATLANVSQTWFGAR